jgi:hypothetical protein
VLGCVLLIARHGDNDSADVGGLSGADWQHEDVHHFANCPLEPN